MGHLPRVSGERRMIVTTRIEDVVHIVAWEGKHRTWTACGIQLFTSYWKPANAMVTCLACLGDL